MHETVKVWQWFMEFRIGSVGVLSTIEGVIGMWLGVPRTSQNVRPLESAKVERAGFMLNVTKHVFAGRS